MCHDCALHSDDAQLHTMQAVSATMCHEAFSRDQPSCCGIISQRIRDRMYSLQDRQSTYNVTFWHARVTIVQRKHTTTLSLCVVVVELQCYSQLYKMLSVAQQCVYVTFFRWQQCKFYVPVFDVNYFPTNLHCFHTAYGDCIERK